MKHEEGMDSGSLNQASFKFYGSACRVVIFSPFIFSNYAQQNTSTENQPKRTRSKDRYLLACILTGFLKLIF